MPHFSEGRVLVSTPSPGEVLSPDPAHSLWRGTTCSSSMAHSSWQHDFQLGHCTQRALSLAIFPCSQDLPQ